jgi:hypothetical protein
MKREESDKLLKYNTLSFTFMGKVAGGGQTDGESRYTDA